MEQPGNPEELRAQSTAFDARLESLNTRLTELEISRPAPGTSVSKKRALERWQEQMLSLTREGDAWGREYLAFLRRTEPLLAGWADVDASLAGELAEWRESLRAMEKSLGE